MEKIRFTFHGKPFEIRGEEVYRLHHEVSGRVYEEIKLAPRTAGKRNGYTLSGAFFTLEEIINLAQTRKHETSNINSDVTN